MKSSRQFAAATFLFVLFIASTAWTQTIARSDIVKALQSGGYVIVMRHASSPREPPDASIANPDNVDRERQLDETGRREAQAMGQALRRLKIPVTEVLSSPTYRAVETAKLMGFTNITRVEELGNEGMRASRDTYIAWLRGNMATPPQSGNRLLITHGPNVAGAFPENAAGMEEGEALIFHAEGKGDAEVVGRLKITDWAGLSTGTPQD